MQLCLNAIVRNESARIERCLKSVAPHISSYVIVDTGSTDGTPDLIRKFFDERDIPGYIHSTEFKNFEQARNFALECARASTLHWDYLLLCDADMELVVTDKQWLKDLDGRTGFGYEMQQRSGDVYYFNLRLLSHQSDAKYIGVTHEYLNVATTGQITGAYFTDHADGANRVHKYERDIALLSAALEKEPNNGRYWFYLGQTYRDMGKHAEAANAYKRRVEIGGWDEEVWNAQCNYAHALGNGGDEGGFLRELLVAYDMRPSRAEVLYDLAKHYREKGKNHASLLFSVPGMAKPYSKDKLFVSNYVYTTGLRDEFSICGFYDETKRAEAGRVCDRLSLDPAGTGWSREQAKMNLQFYLKPLAESVSFFAAHKLPFVPPDGYVAMNPSIYRRSNGKLMAIIRTVNYTITESGHYVIRGDDGTATPHNPIHTRNFLVELSETFEIQSSKEIVAPAGYPTASYDLVRGFEDMRLFEVGGELHANACVRELNSEGWCEQVMFTLSDYGVALDSVRMPRQKDCHEKNWMPVADREQFVYRLGTVTDPDGVRLQTPDLPIDVGAISGGSQVVPFMSGWLCVVHEARQRSDQQRYYQHRFVYLTGAQPTKVQSISKPFVFNEVQIEFAAGLAWHADGKRLHISYGVRDREAWVATVDANDVKEMMYDVATR